MRPWMRFAAAAVVGIAVGVASAMWSVRAGAFGSSGRIGVWTTGTDFGTTRASAETRAVVALRGLLALPPTEARYYQAVVDDRGRPLAGRCRYTITGGALPAKWWSLTLYDPQGYLVANDANIFSVGSAALPAAEQGRWTIAVAPDTQPGHWLPTGRIDRFELTLRAYLPADAGKGNFTSTQLPSVHREGCA